MYLLYKAAASLVCLCTCVCLLGGHKFKSPGNVMICRENQNIVGLGVSGVKLKKARKFV